MPGASVCCPVSLRLDEKRDLGEGRGKTLLQVIVTLEGGSNCEDGPVSQSRMGVCFLTSQSCFPRTYMKEVSISKAPLICKAASGEGSLEFNVLFFEA